MRLIKQKSPSKFAYQHRKCRTCFGIFYACFVYPYCSIGLKPIVYINSNVDDLDMKFKFLLYCLLLILFACKSNKEISGIQIKGTWNILTASGISTDAGEKQAFITFDAGGKMSGNASVNSFFGSYKCTGNKLELSNIGMTRMLGSSMNVERAITAALNAVSTIRINGSTAAMYDSSGKEIMTLKRK